MQSGRLSRAREGQVWLCARLEPRGLCYIPTNTLEDDNKSFLPFSTCGFCCREFKSRRRCFKSLPLHHACLILSGWKPMTIRSFCHLEFPSEQADALRLIYISAARGKSNREQLRRLQKAKDASAARSDVYGQSSLPLPSQQCLGS